MMLVNWASLDGGHEIFLFLKGGTEILVTFVGGGGAVHFYESQSNFRRPPWWQKIILPLLTYCAFSADKYSDLSSDVRTERSEVYRKS